LTYINTDTATGWKILVIFCLQYFSQCDQNCTLRVIKDIGLSLSNVADTVALKEMLGELKIEEGLLNRSSGLAAASGVAEFETKIEQILSHFGVLLRSDIDFCEN
jgi:hypothetical protein